MNTSMNIRLFVYGTLQRGERLNSVLTSSDRPANFLGEARTLPGFRLYTNGSYPICAPQVLTHSHAEVCQPDPSYDVAVEGEVWEVPTLLLDKCDRIELGAGYCRRLIQLVEGPGLVSGIVDIYVQDLAAARDPALLLIEDGSFKREQARAALRSAHIRTVVSAARDGKRAKLGHE